MSQRILVTFPFAPGTPGGGTFDCVQLTRALARAGAEMTVAFASSSGAAPFPRRPLPEQELGREQIEELESEGIRVLITPPHPVNFRLDGLPLKRRIARLLDEEPLDAVLSYWHEASFLDGLLRRRGVVFGMNAAASFNQFLDGIPWTNPLTRVRNLLLKRPFQRADVIFARSQFTRGELEQVGGVDTRRVRVVYLGVDPRFAEVERGPATRVTNLFYFGKLVSSKGIFDALEALGAVQRGGQSDWRLRVAGWGDQEAVMAAARSHGIEDKVETLGGLSRSELADELAQSHLSLLPSHTESFGLANAESQAAGVAVCAYGVAAVPEVVEDGVTGWLAPMGRVDLLADAIGEALRNPERTWAFGRAGRERIATVFSWERAARDTLAGLAEARGARA